MHRRILIIAWLPILLFAHDISKHKGKPTVGRIVSVEDHQMVIQSGGKSIPVVLNAETKFERGNRAITKSDLKKGEQVSVFGTLLGTGELVAREIKTENSKATPHKQH
jgi:hypothetical protein